MRLGRPIPTTPRARASQQAATYQVEQLAAKFLASRQVSAGWLKRMKAIFKSQICRQWVTIYEMAAPGAIDAWTSERLTSAPNVRWRAASKRRRTTPLANRKLVTSVTVAKELVVARQFLLWAVAGEYLAEMPKIRPVEAVSTYVAPDYTPEMVAQLLAELPDRHTRRGRYLNPVREFFTCQWAQAFRPGELETLTWGAVNLRHKQVTVYIWWSKSKQERVVALAAETLEVLEQLAAELPRRLPTALVFGRHNYAEALRLAAARCKFPRPTRHNLRNFRLSELGNNPGTAPAALQFFAGHKHLATTDIYIKSRTQATRDMLAALPIRSRSG